MGLSVAALELFRRHRSQRIMTSQPTWLDFEFCLTVIIIHNDAAAPFM